MKKVLSSYVFPLVLLTASSAFAAEQCPAINCDCESLTSESWVDACKRYESKIKQSCVDNANTPKDYCSIHGPDATPVALSLKKENTTLISKSDAAVVREKIDTIYWAVEVDIDNAKEAFSEANYTRTLQILKVVNANIDQAFLKLQQVDASLSAENKGDVKRMWKEIAPNTIKYNESLHAFGDEVAAKIDGAKTKKEKKIFNVLAQKIYRMSGKSFELAGYAYGQAGKYSNAAKEWKKAADVSVTLAAINIASGGKKSTAKFSEFQAAARLHRASYHWLNAEKLDYATESLKESQKYVSRTAQEGIEYLVNNSNEQVKTGILSGR